MIHIAEKNRSFTLVEVSLAVAILAVGTIIALGLFIPSIRSVEELNDSAIAGILYNQIDQELKRLEFETVVTATVGGRSIWLVSRRDATRIARTGFVNEIISESGLPAENHPNDGDPPGIEEGDRFFLIRISRITTDDTNELYFDDAKAAESGSIVLGVQISWPYLVRSGVFDGEIDSWNDKRVQGIEVDSRRRNETISTTSVRR